MQHGELVKQCKTKPCSNDLRPLSSKAREMFTFIAYIDDSFIRDCCKLCILVLSTQELEPSVRSQSWRSNYTKAFNEIVLKCLITFCIISKDCSFVWTFANACERFVAMLRKHDRELLGRKHSENCPIRRVSKVPPGCDELILICKNADISASINNCQTIIAPPKEASTVPAHRNLNFPHPKPDDTNRFHLIRRFHCVRVSFALIGLVEAIYAGNTVELKMSCCVEQLVRQATSHLCLRISTLGAYRVNRASKHTLDASQKKSWTYASRTTLSQLAGGQLTIEHLQPSPGVKRR